MRIAENGHIAIDGYILIQASSGSRVRELAERIAQIPGVVKADRVYGAYDLIAEVREQKEEARVSPAAAAIGLLDGVLRAIPLPIAASSIDSRESDAA